MKDYYQQFTDRVLKYVRDNVLFPTDDVGEIDRALKHAVEMLPIDDVDEPVIVEARR